MSHNRNVTTTERIILGLVAVSSVMADPAAERAEALKQAKEQADQQKAIAEETKHKKEKVSHQVPKHEKSHAPKHEHRNTKASFKRY